MVPTEEPATGKKRAAGRRKFDGERQSMLSVVIRKAQASGRYGYEYEYRVVSVGLGTRTYRSSGQEQVGTRR